MSADFHGLGRALVLFGALIILFGLLLLAAPKIPWLGRLPGDILVRREHWAFYFPLASSIVASLILTLVIWLIRRFKP